MTRKILAVAAMLIPLGAASPASAQTPCSTNADCAGLVCVAGVCQPCLLAAECTDNNACNGIEVCAAGVCQPGTPPSCDDANPCTADTCDAALGCQHTALVDGSSCSDANACNGVETCLAGICTPGSPLACNDANPCTTDTCDPALGCQHTALADGSSCSDANACNGAETCLAGICAPGTPLNCNDNNICTTDTCDPVAGCQYAAVPNGTLCSDGNACNGIETCQAGACTAGLALFCNDSNPCTTDSCDPASGCVSTPVANGTSCSDGNACNGVEVCQGGLCAQGTAPDCNDSNPCTSDSCDPAVGCVHTPLANGTSCADGNLCNGAETCQAGVCAPGIPLVCDDGNACTSDSCDPASGCHSTAVTNGTPCSDGNACNGLETCQSGICGAGTPLDCNDNNLCTADSCDRITGCQHAALANGTPCSDGNACNGAEVCQSGACTNGAPLNCNDANPCTTDSCDPLLGCEHLPVANGTSCSDGNVCNGAETCQSGLCGPGSAPNCNDANPCTLDGCDPVTGCQHTSLPNGSSCSDGNACDGLETCQAGTCFPGVALNCNDLNPCTTDSCDPVAGCIHAAVANGTTCSDGNLCNGVEACQGGVCGTGTPLNCNDGNACTSDTCNGLSGCVHTPIPGCTSCNVSADCNDGNPCTADVCSGGACVNTVVSNGTPCGDGNVCNGNETCQAGACTAGVALNCNDANPCTTDTCDPGLGCQHPPVVNGTSCSDGNACNGAEICLGGACQPGAAPNCNDNNPCTADSCDAAAGCIHSPVAIGTSCTDNNPCNGIETCQTGGICAAGPPVNCNDFNSCTTDICDPIAGCQHTVLPDNSSCSDNNACNGVETCHAGVCTPGTAPTCDDRNPCTSDACNPASGCTYTPVADGTSCADANACNGAEVCQAAVCKSPGPLNCDDGNRCTTDSCDPVVGCRHANVANGTSCSDGNACNGAEACQLGICRAGVAPNCDDRNQCTIDSCDPVAGCQHASVADATSCSDGNICNGAEVCAKGVCKAGTPPPCDDNNRCSTDACNAAGGCQHTRSTDGTPCTDGNTCNGLETCQTGVCSPGTAPNCDDGNPCTSDWCDRILGCRHGTVADGSPCNDGNVCNGTETCQLGFCLPGTAIDCSDGNPCTVDSCDPKGGCHSTVAADGSSCDDGNRCNGIEVCRAGVCNAGTMLDCNDGDACTIDTCDAATGCHHGPCDDGNPLTADTCNPATGCHHDVMISGDQLGLSVGTGIIRMKVVNKGGIIVSNPPLVHTSSDPVMQGGSLRLVTSGATPMDVSYPMPAASWSYLGRPDGNHGFKYTDRKGKNGPIRSVVIHDGSTTGVSGAVPRIRLPLADDPHPVAVVLTLGTTRYCMSFGGLSTFVPDHRFIAKNADPPSSCPP